MATLSRNLKLKATWSSDHVSNIQQRRRLTKIGCTLGPRTSSVETLGKLIDNGMDVAWLNFAHGTHKAHGDMIKNLGIALKKKGASAPSISVVAETQGPKIRTGKVKNGSINLVAGQEVDVTNDTSIIGDEKTIVVDFENLISSTKEKILIDHGQLLLIPKHIDLQRRIITCVVSNSYTLGDNKVVHLPGAVFHLPAVSEKDRADVLFAISQGITILCAPVRTPWNVQQIKDIVMRSEYQNIKILAKIESTEGIDNFDFILQSCDGIVISRGDLGVELPMEQVFKAQKMMISKCTAAAKPVIVSSQMLESMIKNPRPTRAEATDVANAVLDGTEGVMLSGETSIGDYPAEAVHYMSNTCAEAESVEAVSDYPSLFEALKANSKNQKIPEVVSSYSVRMSNDMQASAIIMLTETGNTARSLCKYRPRAPVVCVTHSEQAAHFIGLTRGAIPLVIAKSARITDQMYIDQAIEYAKKSGISKPGDKIVVVSGVVEGVSGQSNTIKVLDCV